MIFLGLVLKNNNFMLLNLYNYVIINKQRVAMPKYGIGNSFLWNKGGKL